MNTFIRQTRQRDRQRQIMHNIMYCETVQIDREKKMKTTKYNLYNNALTRHQNHADKKHHHRRW